MSDDYSECRVEWSGVPLYWHLLCWVLCDRYLNVAGAGAVSRWRHCASNPQYASYIFTIMPRKICPFWASKIIIKMSPSALQILSAGAEFAVRGLHPVLLALPSVQCAEYWRGFVCRILPMFAATSVSSFRALITYYPLAIVRTFFCFWQMSIPFSPFLKYFSRRADTRLCVCSRGAVAVVSRTEVPGEAGGGRAPEADDLRSTVRCVNISGDRGFTALLGIRSFIPAKYWL